MPVKERLDILLVKNGIAPSRETAKALIMSGNVYVDGQRREKAGESVNVDAKLSVIDNKLKYVSRGGLKLEKALNEFAISVSGKVCADIGASTGGFTDCMLKSGASAVYAVDVGYGQLDWNLRNDSRVIVLEKTNARYLSVSDIGARCDFICVDVSFISLSKIIPVINAQKGILRANGEAVCLIKPQFECGRKYVGKKGVVKDASVHEYVINKVVSLGEENGLAAAGITFSPIRGPNGNIEYLIYFIDGGSMNLVGEQAVSEVVKTASENI